MKQKAVIRQGSNENPGDVGNVANAERAVFFTLVWNIFSPIYAVLLYPASTFHIKRCHEVCRISLLGCYKGMMGTYKLLPFPVVLKQIQVT